METSPEQRTLDLAGGPINVLIGGAGPDLLLLHHDVGPFGWTRFHDLLARRFRVFAPDMPGFGQSPRLEWARHPRDLALLMLAAARRLALRDYVLVGPGFGGWVAAEMAVAAYPEMQRLVLVAPAGVKPEHSFILDQIMEEPVAYLRSGFDTVSGFAAHFPEPRAPELKQRLDACRESIARLTWKPYMYSYELPEALPELQLPVTLVWSEGDRVVPFECAALWQRLLPQCSLRTVAGAGHFLELDQPQLLAEVVAQVDAPVAVRG